MVDVVQDIMERDCTILGLMDHDNYTRIVTANCPLAVLPRREATCAHTIMQESGTVFMLPDMLADWRFAQSPHVEAGLRSYAGTQLRYHLPGTDVEVAFGSLCVASYSKQPPLSPVQASTLQRLAQSMVHMIVERASLHRKGLQEEVFAKLAAALPDLKAHNVVGRIMDVLRECYPTCHVSYQVHQDGIIHLRGNMDIPYTEVQQWLWEDTDAIHDIVLRDNHIPGETLQLTGRTLRAVIVKMKAVGCTYLVVETDDLKTIFDDVDAGFVLQCAMTICNVLMGEHLQAALAAKEQFLRGVTHELRTPIHAIIASAELLLEETQFVEEILASPGRTSGLKSSPSMLKVIRDQGQHLLKMVNKVIQLEQLDPIDQHDLTMSMHNIGLVESDVVSSVMDSSLYKDKNGRVVIVVDNRLPSSVELLFIDGDLLKQALLCLLLNALSTTNEGHILFKTSLGPDSSYLDYEMVDTGVGVVPEDWARVFLTQEKVEGDDSKTPVSRRCALSNAARITSLLNGALTLVSSAPGRGSHFRLRLHKPHIESEENPQSMRRRLEQSTMPLTYFMPIEQDIETLPLVYAARNLESLGFVQTLRDQASIAIADVMVEPDVLRKAIYDWQIVIVVTDRTETSKGRSGPDTRMLRCPFPTVRAQLWSVIDAALDIYKQHDLHALRPRLTNLDVDSRAPSPGLAAVSHMARRDRSSIRILIVDDNDINVKVLATYAKKRKFAYATARNGQEAVERYGEAVCHHDAGVFTLVLMDLQMPVMDGAEATRQIRELERKHELRPSLVYMVSGQSLDKDKKRSLDAGADGYYVKPFSISSMDDLIQLHFKDRAGSRSGEQV
ncbi:hypothetical protein PUNSTDRAFT_121940 [Punctularia strigosozonata HHB-11173 SS5]|uniref:uncharacterized protein n=1 Tax=Punctularia strigosozonata (strain HHB-11173) TaxID=741275 RepID=UPI0004417CAE|nr:uncharacterized protein PUNSTDRAFT_121940 [Punctularia strigosozonata HHB-11173 SS5]EIN05980.1 hypothetical protein PUNSTDRAFT_121940 [Punctularia strigosozonata HHB-11173 SS5]